MDADWIIPAFVLIDTLMQRLGCQRDVRAQGPDSAIILIAVAAAKYFLNHHERAGCVLREAHYRSGRIDITRCNRRLQKLADWLAFIATSLGEILLTGEVFVIDSLPVLVCRRVRARRCRKVRDLQYCGYCAAKKEKFFGWRLPVICTPSGAPVSFQLLPAAFHDWPPVHELAVILPSGARLFGDKANNSADDAASILAETGVRLIPVRRAHMQPHGWFVDEIELHDYRHTIETVNSQCEKMG
ncbi:MAG: hypothetical protein MI924_27650 [Chloroflexales bacterium]|nr:hypothetical protein [Chloroflexales bacterium]